MNFTPTRGTAGDRRNVVTPGSVGPSEFAASLVRYNEAQTTSRRGDVHSATNRRGLHTPSTNAQGTAGQSRLHYNGPSDEAVREHFEAFWFNFIDSAETSAPVKYDHRLRSAVINDRIVQSFPVDLEDIRSIRTFLQNWIVKFPRVCLPVIDSFLNNRKEQLEREHDMEPSLAIMFRPYNLNRKSNMRDLDPSDIENLVSLSGIVIRCSELIPEMAAASFLCHGMKGTGSSRRSCGNRVQEVVNEDGHIMEPTMCNACKRAYTFELDHQDCKFYDKQIVKLQETPESIPHGETPHTILLHCYDDLFDYAKPGDRVDITGIFRMQPVRVNPRRREVKSVNRTYIDVCHILRTSKTRTRSCATDNENEAADEESRIGMSEHQIREVMRIKNEGRVYERLVSSLAPSIWGNDDVKKGLLCQMFGGNAEVVSGEETGSGTIRQAKRGEIHLLLCGDPSTAKSQLLNYAHSIAPRATIATGRGTSAVGLTAYISKDPDSKELILESGALVLADRGLCCIDEFDKMDDNSRAILHEAMEQQTVSVAKAGIICSLNARTAILACANPVASRYDPMRSVVQNINLSSTLLSRFDLIYLMLDIHTQEGDARLSEHIIRIFCASQEAETMSGNNGDLDRQTFCDYVTYAKASCHPMLGDEAAQILIDEWVEMRSAGGSARRNVTATPRQLESLVRISEALSRMELNPVVEVRHVHEAVRSEELIWMRY